MITTPFHFIFVKEVAIQISLVDCCGKDMEYILVKAIKSI